MEVYNMPNRCLHTLYYRQYREAVIREERAREEDRRNKKKVANTHEGQSQFFQGNVLADMQAAREAAELIQDEL